MTCEGMQESSWDSEAEAAEAQAQYEESIRQLHLIVSIASNGCSLSISLEHCSLIT